MSDSVNEDPVKSAVDRRVGLTAVREMAVLAQELNRQQAEDGRWAKRIVLTLLALLAMAVLVAIVEPSLIGNALRGIAGMLSGWR